jgi:hypothetical protein
MFGLKLKKHRPILDFLKHSKMKDFDYLTGKFHTFEKSNGLGRFFRKNN